MRRKRGWLIGGLAVAMLATVQGGVAFAGPAACDNRNNNTIAKLLECVTLEGVREHQAAFQAIANANGGNRFSGFGGYNASVDYVVDRLEAAGYHPTVQPFQYTAFIVEGPAALQQVAPGSVTYLQNTDFSLMDQTDAGDVTAAVTAVDLQLGLGNASSSGCEAADFTGFPRGNIALIQRGHLHLRDQGRERRPGRGFGCDHVQPRQRAGTVRPGRFHPQCQQHQRDPGPVRHLRPRCRVGRHGRAAHADLHRRPARDQDDVQRARRNEQR